MGALLVIKDDLKLRGLIEGILPADQAKAAGKGDTPAISPLKREERGQEVSDLTLAEVVREFLRAERDTGNADHIHESIIEKVERSLIGIILEEERGNQVRAAKKLGITRYTLRKKIKDLQIITRVVIL
jgi:DNA-binding protein Fis